MNDLKNYVYNINRKTLTEQVVNQAVFLCESSCSREFSEEMRENFDIENYGIEELTEFLKLLECYNLITSSRNMMHTLYESNDEYGNWLKSLYEAEAQAGGNILDWIKGKTQGVTNKVQQQKWIPGTAGNVHYKAQKLARGTRQEAQELANQKLELENKMKELQRQHQDISVKYQNAIKQQQSALGKSGATGRQLNKYKNAAPYTGNNFKDALKQTGRDISTGVKKAGATAVGNVIGAVGSQAGKVANTAQNIQQRTQQYAKNL